MRLRGLDVETLVMHDSGEAVVRGVIDSLNATQEGDSRSTGATPAGALALPSKPPLLGAPMVVSLNGGARPMNVHSGGPVGLTALVAVMLTGCQRAEPPKPALEGAWSIASIRVTGPDSAANTTVQPSVYLFGHTHYSMMRVTGNQPRALAASDRVTDAEKIRAYDSFVANSGTYEIADSTLTTHPTVARSPNFMSGGSDRYAFRVSGDTLWLSNTGADLRTRIGGQLVSPRTTTGTTTLVLVRQK